MNANNPKISSMDFACKVAAYAKTGITGVFIENLYYEYIAIGDAISPAYFSQERESTVLKADTEQSIRIFRDQCKLNGIIPEVYVDKGEPIREVIYESRFADLIIVDPDISFNDGEEQMPSHFVKEILANAECPVLIVPEKFEDIDEIVFCYDGSASSVFAIKLFTYILPEFSKKKVILLEINKTGKEEFNESHRRMLNWLRAHYEAVYYHTLNGDVKDELFTWFFMKEKMLVVMGAYGRPMLSRFFKKSNADILMRMVDLPLFITHH